MAALLNFWNSPTKQSSKRSSVNGTPADARGTKRKAKPDPYDAMDDDDDDIIPARKTPTSQRTARSRLSSATPGSSSRSRPSLPSSGKRPRGRPSLKSQQAAATVVVDTVTASKTIVEPDSTHAKASQVAPAQPDSLVPEAPMGGLELLGNHVSSALPSSAPKSQPETAKESAAQEKGKAKSTETRQQPSRKSQAERKQQERVVEQEQEQDDNEDRREEHEIHRLIKHRMVADRSGTVELLVHWEGEGEQDATWETEEEIQQGAEETLYEYWRSQGGRISALFHKPKNPPPEIYHVFKLLRHEKKNLGGFQFEVQWVGHSAERADTTMEAESKVKKAAPELLDAYWESVGGRAKHLAPRGRAKRVRTAE
ncbi:hypothetical protein F5B22DRAFT_640152 [Xylaria bambusicola]|uniref:uncharacterized protein n=1 Tax=Xylaria bambusicola TaxID=326684 RepID=UPI0020085927|nr:uncharacterized protein F5B22DRAFT_640152 [Xylaria bambusicola]KAI0503423.1 hypothetical protein F5B22DRAFT_640152 [Xylaria bambusicola]